MTYAEKAGELFREGDNCSQAVVPGALRGYADPKDREAKAQLYRVV